MRDFLQKLNSRIEKTPGTVWVWGLLVYGVIGGTALAFGDNAISQFVIICVAVLFWFSNPYICYIAARSLNRRAFLWGVFGCFFIPLPVIIIAHLTGKGPVMKMSEGPQS